MLASLGYWDNDGFFHSASSTWIVQYDFTNIALDDSLCRHWQKAADLMLSLRAEGRQAQKLCSSPLPKIWWRFCSATSCCWERTLATSCLPSRPPETPFLVSTAQGTSLLQSRVSLSKSAGICLLSELPCGDTAITLHVLSSLSLPKEQCYWNIGLLSIRGHCIFTPFPRGCVLTCGTLRHASGRYNRHPSQQSKACHLQRLLGGKHTKAESLLSCLYLAVTY